MSIAVLTAGLAFTPITAFAQDVGSSPPPTAPADGVGPRELQNFSLSGTVTRPADEQPPQRPQVAPTSKSTASLQAAQEASAPPRAVPRSKGAREPQATSAAPGASAPSVEQRGQVTAPPSVPAAAAVPDPGPAFPPPETTTSTLPPAAHGLPTLPWLLAAFALIVGGGFLFWRSRSRTALAGGPDVDFLSAQPQPRPTPPPLAPARAPASPPATPESVPPPQPLGIVSTGLRPWLEMAMQPLRCILTDDSVTVEFELELFNSGSSPARDIHVAAAMINAGESQDDALVRFFAQSPGPGDRIPVIEPLKRVAFATQIVTPRDQVQALEIGGRAVFVPVLAFNATYGWGRKDGQTSVSYLLGRQGKSDKLGPFRLDLGPRLFRDIGARPLPVGLRR